MARRDDYEHFSMGLPAGSDVLKDVDQMCEDTGLQRGEVCRLIVLTWSKARRGKVQELWGFTPGVIFAAGNGQIPASPEKDEEVGIPPAPRKRKVVNEVAAAAIKGITIDLD